jgi:hypothetical protein
MEQDKRAKTRGKASSGIPLTVYSELAEILSIYAAGCCSKACKANMPKILLLSVVAVVVLVAVIVVVQ